MILYSVVNNVLHLIKCIKVVYINCIKYILIITIIK